MSVSALQLAFEKNFSKTENGCWLWAGAVQSRGRYGSFSWKGKKQGAHIQSYLLYKGEIARGLLVLHECDNGRCVNPAHLSLGTQLQNMQQAAERNRAGRKQQEFCKRGHVIDGFGKQGRYCRFCVWEREKERERRA